MPVTALLDIHLKAQSLETGYGAVHDTLADTRAFAGCLGVDVLIDNADPTHLLLVERWESAEHDAAYRAWRASPDGASTLGDVLAGRPALTFFTPAPHI